jgi:hypothetical protein
MHSELSDACLNAIQKATKPISLSEIGAACLGRTKPNANLVGVLKQLAGRAVIHEWPSYRRSQIFGSRPLRSAVEDAFVAALDDAPLTIAKATKPVSRVLGRVSEESVLAELRGLAPKLAASRKIMQVHVGLASGQNRFSRRDRNRHRHDLAIGPIAVDRVGEHLDLVRADIQER